MTRRLPFHWILAALMLLAAALALFGFSAPAQAAAADTAVVNVDALNLRAGPGLGYRVYKVLRLGQALDLRGRSADSLWLEVRLSDGSGGWVYAAYVTASRPIGGLPVTEAAGGPAAPTAEPQVFSCANTPWDLCMSIVNTQATVYLQNYPANAPVAVRLAAPAGGAEVEAARGATDASGSARIEFRMPASWSDGRPLTETSLVLSARTVEGAFSRTATIRYAP